MIVDRRETPRGEIALRLRGGGFEIVYNGVFVMSHVNGDSETRLAAETLSRVMGAGASRPDGLRVLVGGLGMGYTLRAALDYPGVSAVTVAEIEPAVIEWNRLHFGDMNGFALDDARCAVICGDVLEVVEARPAPFDAILLDTDNGPASLVRDDNQAIYSSAGLRAFRDSLRRGGCLGVWSANANAGFERLMRRVLGGVEAVEVPCPYAPDPDYIYVSRRQSVRPRRGNRVRA
ncbi:MAG: spermidine synthase [Ignavibacteriales bacterium]